jgi:protein O-mannosyl-transferase
MTKLQKKKSTKTPVKAPFQKIKPRRKIDWTVAIIIGLCFVLYGNTIPNHYSLDDDLVTYNNKRVEAGIKGIPGIWASSYSEGKMTYEYRPVVKTTFALEYQFFKGNPHVSHFINILLYALICVLLFKLLKKIFKEINPLFLFVTVIIFLAHPIHTEVVSSLKNRDELLSFLSGLLTLHFIIKYVDENRIIYIFTAFIIYLLAYFSKESALIFLAIYPLTLYYYGGQQTKKLIIIMCAIVVAILIAKMIPKLYLPKPDREVFLFENPLFFKKGLMFKLGTGMITLLFYLKTLLYPHPLLFYYGYNQIPVVGLGNLTAIVSLLIHLGIFIFAIWKLREKHILSYAILFYLICISMFSNIVKPAMGIVAERYAFSATLGFSMVVAYFIFLILKKKPKASLISFNDRVKILIALIILLVPYTAKTLTRNTKWNTQLSLYRNDIGYLGNSAKANSLCASAMLSQVKKEIFNGNVPADLEQKVDSIIRYYQKSIDIYPNYYSSYNNIGTVYFAIIKDFEKGIPYFIKALQLKPDYPEASYNLAYSYEMSGKFDDAIRCYRNTIAMKPDNIKAMSNLANIYFDNKGYYDSAVALNKKIMTVDTASDIPYVNIGNYYLKKKDTITAVSYMEIAVKKFPLNYNLCKNLSKYFTLRDPAKSEKYYNMAVKAQKQIEEEKAKKAN